MFGGARRLEEQTINEAGQGQSKQVQSTLAVFIVCGPLQFLVSHCKWHSRLKINCSVNVEFFDLKLMMPNLT